MRYADLHRLYAAVPVTTAPLVRRPTATLPADPDAGARWGKASSFSWSNEAAGDGGGSLSVESFEPAPRDYMRVIDATAQIMSEVVRIEDPNDSSVWVEADRMTRIAFGYTEFPPKPHPGSPQPSRTTVYDLAFVLHPPVEDEAVQ